MFVCFLLIILVLFFLLLVLCSTRHPPKSNHLVETQKLFKLGLQIGLTLDIKGWNGSVLLRSLVVCFFSLLFIVVDFIMFSVLPLFDVTGFRLMFTFWFEDRKNVFYIPLKLWVMGLIKLISAVCCVFCPWCILDCLWFKMDYFKESLCYEFSQTTIWCDHIFPNGQHGVV